MVITEYLRLVKGLAVYGDPLTAEQQLETIDFYGASGNGFHVDSDTPFQPNIPQLKSGGVWIDSALSDGRTLTSNTVENVIETLNVHLVEDDFALLNMRLRKLNEMRESARQFFTERWQVAPVYLEWYAKGAPASQFALVYNIDIVPEWTDYSDPAQKPALTISMTFEREPFWRAIPPGANPRLWYNYLNGIPANTNLDLVTGTPFQSKTIYNVTTWEGTTANPTTYREQSYVEIDGSTIPGDAPALCMINCNLLNGESGQTVNQLYVSRASKPITGTNHAGVVRPQMYHLNNVDAALSSPTGKTTTSIAFPGFGVDNGAGTLRSTQVVLAALAAYTSTFPIQWPNTLTPRVVLDAHLMRGRYMVFVRAGVTSPGTAVTDVFMRVSFVQGQVGSYVTNEILVPSGSAGVGAARLSYLGTVDIPLNSRDYVTSTGYGAQINEGTASLQVNIDFRNANTTTARTIVFNDIILMPIDEPSQLVVNGQGYIFFDSTGYFSHGDKQSLSPSSNGTTVAFSELRGEEMTLLPYVDQRLHFLFATTQPLSSVSISQPVAFLELSLDIVPRWMGVRDV